MSATTIITIVVVGIAGAIVLKRKWPDFKQELEVKKALATIEREAYLKEALIVAEKKGVQRARAGLLGATSSPVLNNLLQKAKESKINIPKAKESKINIPKAKEVKVKNFKHVKKKKKNFLNLPGVNISIYDDKKNKPQEKPKESKKEEEPQEEFSNMRKMMGVK